LCKRNVPRIGVQCLAGASSRTGHAGRAIPEHPRMPVDPNTPKILKNLNNTQSGLVSLEHLGGPCQHTGNNLQLVGYQSDCVQNGRLTFASFGHSGPHFRRFPYLSSFRSHVVDHRMKKICRITTSGTALVRSVPSSRMWHP
jgi:hypothetical protein